jgi:phosphoribosylamine--glycine ligase
LQESDMTSVSPSESARLKVLVVGSGAREHALAWRISESPRVAAVLCAPGNPGTRAVATNFPVEAGDVVGLVKLAREQGVGLVVVGPEAPLVAGLVDALAAVGIRAFGPSRAAAELEGSKVLAKELMAKYGVPTAAFRVFDDADAATDYVRACARPLVVKADGLAAGKGVVVAKDAAEAIAAIDAMMRERVYGDAGRRVVVEEVLVGEEVSYHVVSDGTRYVALAAAQDHKRLGDGDAGPNTGGMGAYSPPPVVTPEVERKILTRVIEPMLAGLRAEGRTFRGALFAGVMVVDGEPLTLEYNVRFGDPECEALMARFDGDLLPLLDGAARGDLSGVEPKFGAGAALCVVLAAAGYPVRVRSGDAIRGLEAVATAAPGARVFHAGTRLDGEVLRTSGGRVLTVCASGETIDAAAALAYRAADVIDFDGRQLRRDIGHRARSR